MKPLVDSRKPKTFITETERRAAMVRLADLLAVPTDPQVACSRLGISYAAFRNWKHSHTFFQKLLEDVAERRTQRLEQEAWRRALCGSDTMLIFMLKAARPDVYRERASLELTGPGGSPLELGDAQRAARILALIEAAQRGDLSTVTNDDRDALEAEFYAVPDPRPDGSDLV